MCVSVCGVWCIIVSDGRHRSRSFVAKNRKGSNRVRECQFSRGNHVSSRGSENYCNISAVTEGDFECRDQESCKLNSANSW